ARNGRRAGGPARRTCARPRAPRARSSSRAKASRRTRSKWSSWCWRTSRLAPKPELERAKGIVRDRAARGGPRLPALEWHDELGSTSDRLKDLARAGAPASTVVMGERQNGGRGREGRAWQSPQGGLYLSVLLRPESEQVSLIPLAAGVAVAEAVLEFGVRSELKWPNDVLV